MGHAGITCRAHVRPARARVADRRQTPAGSAPGPARRDGGGDHPQPGRAQAAREPRAVLHRLPAQGLRLAGGPGALRRRLPGRDHARSQDLRRRARGRLRLRLLGGRRARLQLLAQGRQLPHARRARPLDDSPGALRTALWLVTDEKYKAALFNYLKKKGEDVYVVEDPRRPPSFSKEVARGAVGRTRPVRLVARAVGRLRARGVGPAGQREGVLRLGGADHRRQGGALLRDDRRHAPGHRGHALRRARAGLHPR